MPPCRAHGMAGLPLDTSIPGGSRQRFSLSCQYSTSAPFLPQFLSAKALGAHPVHSNALSKSLFFREGILYQEVSISLSTKNVL